MEEETGRVRALIENGAEIAGGAVGGALGFMAGGPAGAAALGAGGSALVVVLKRIGAEVSDRLLGPRERVRLGGVLALVSATIQERMRRGEVPRQDGFFDEDARGRSAAEEVAESVLLKCQREPEERKLRYIANLLSNVTFDSSINAELAHQLSKTAEQLSYRQFCLLKIAAARRSLPLRNSAYRELQEFPKALYQVLYECYDLYQRGLINFGTTAALGLTDVVPAQMTPQGVGADLFNLMRLAEIPDVDLVPVVRQLC